MSTSVGGALTWVVFTVPGGRAAMAEVLQTMRSSPTGALCPLVSWHDACKDEGIPFLSTEEDRATWAVNKGPQ